MFVGNSVQEEPEEEEPAKDTLMKVRAIADYKAEEKVELSFKEGDCIYVFEEHDSGWWKGELERDGKIGLFPR